MISNHAKIHKIIIFYGKRGWVQEKVFLSHVLADIELNGGHEDFEDWLKNPSTLKIRKIMESYKKYSMIDKKFDENKHFNNVHGLDSASCYF